ncbi:MAG: S-ribosylhomocysteine lyase [Paramuribaculum sp.]|nr:S-ribosylhomocysteine lyase [Paramuribaculum sp.]
MKKIASFTIDHNRLKRGIFVSRRDTTPSGDTITTFDIRMTEPNRQTPLNGATIHTIEHLAATYLRNREDWADKIVYWGPMGCLTGNYLIMQDDLSPADILDLVRDTFIYIRDFEGDIPGATPRDCGNYSFMDAAGAKAAAKTFVDEVLANPAEENLNYPA